MISQQINCPLIMQNGGLPNNLVEMFPNKFGCKSVLEASRQPVLCGKYQDSVALLRKMKVSCIENVGDYMVSERSKFAVDAPVGAASVVRIQILNVLKKHKPRRFDSQNIADPKEHLTTVFTKALLITHHAERLAGEPPRQQIEIGKICDVLLVSGELNNVPKSDLIRCDVINCLVCIQCSSVYL